MSWARVLKVELVPGPKLGPSEKIDPRIFYSIKAPIGCQALVLLKMSSEQPEPSLGLDSLLHFSVQLYIESKFTIYKLENKIWNTSQSQMVLSWYSIPITNGFVMN